jgi:hypothetical protein
MKNVISIGIANKPANTHANGINVQVWPVKKKSIEVKIW